MLFLYLMKVSLLLAVLTLGYRWLIQFETFSKLNRALLWLNVLAAWSLPLIPLADWGPVEVQAEFHQTIPKIAKVVPVVKQEISSFNPAPSFINSHHLPQWNIMDALTLIYLAGVAIMLAIFLFQVGRLIRLLWKSPSQKSADGVIFTQDERNTSPYSFFRWVIYNPHNHSKSTLQHILAHETEHVLQWHSLDLLLAELQRIALWFNPFAWFHQRLVQANLEYLADRGVLDRGCEKKEYQFDLLRTVLQNRELPLTNSFAQSLLKKRIRMMNKKPSHYFAWGKYGLLIGILYLSSAFVAPYTVKVAEFLPPLVGVVFEEDNTSIPEVNVEEHKEESKKIKKEIPIENKVDSTFIEPGKPKVKGILIKNDTLYWAITPLTTWDQINAMKGEMRKFGYDMIINKLQYDPLQSFITSLSVHIKDNGGSGTGGTGDDDSTPMEGYSGYVSKGGLGMGQRPPAPLKTEMETDYQNALGIKKSKDVEFFEHELVSRIGPNSGGSVGPAVLSSDRNKQLLEREGFGKSEQNTLLFTDKHANAEYYINTMPSNRDEASKITIDKIKKVAFREDNQHKTYFIIYTK
ncbi:M56 family metallopeptidase [Dyadobacter pollutisoli]|uniref:M56 family metallopeptidase n=1 Tax=Dyadobacter pollutisoli TaxID=2910158 RepID=A0A9E8N763_9BACT|nr:M56 family metallopeptidase [Dyadobacter pollutisoli]WAC09816.1 M56 family metallopeptidase [Dyadobacter pollutisoli]